MARNARFAVYLEPYRLDANHVGESIYRPVYISRHRSAKAAARVLASLINGKSDKRASDYLRAVNGNPFPIALRYVARDSVAPFKAYSCTQLRNMES